MILDATCDLLMIHTLGILLLDYDKTFILKYEYSSPNTYSIMARNIFFLNVPRRL